MDIGDIKYLEAPAKITKLSEAMRIGAKMRMQGRGNLFFEGRSCAMGAAYEGATGKVCRALDYSDVFRIFPILTKGISFSNLGREIFRKNDSGESRESIADWLESQGY